VREADADTSPIIDTWFRLDATPTDRWAVTIDDLRITRDA
jgi:hypothetical protein